ncbi:4'-phosphopantetheinyl transferase superfamily protein [Flammeovirga sp. MY04]|uniref:4'-phosphopantetheinyl transferase family protein n=1 Tax=Flammeovirga sp. MY04 TaxID=1191459 RepID=UPI0008063932|nr:4'-phosphopantetheinyl transferase superfamily protein [Flammeovirga sp. MY04]ANQ49184.1 4'-phosphopantetheinyl transferase superfamily protein [Flammeovirga sp. MY04]
MTKKPYDLYTTAEDSLKGDINLLDGDERKRYKRFLTDQKKEEFLMGRTFLKHCLSKHLNIPPKQISFSYSKNGKPYLSSIYGASVFFNLSHSNGYFVVGISNKELGVDMEPITKLDEKKLKWFLSPQELKEVESITDENQRKMSLFKLFTMKEAFIKATDKSFVLSDFSFWFVDNEWKLQVEDTHSWKFDTKMIGNEITIAICYQED